MNEALARPKIIGARINLGFAHANDPKPAVESIRKHLKIYPYTPGGSGTTIATILDAKATLPASFLPTPVLAEAGSHQRNVDTA